MLGARRPGEAEILDGLSQGERVIVRTDHAMGFYRSLPGWVLDNNPDVPGLTDWFQGNDAVFPAHAGAPTAYTVTFTITDDDTGAEFCIEHCEGVTARAVLRERVDVVLTCIQPEIR